MEVSVIVDITPKLVPLHLFGTIPEYVYSFAVIVVGVLVATSINQINTVLTIVAAQKMVVKSQRYFYGIIRFLFCINLYFEEISVRFASKMRYIKLLHYHF